jgi:FG-GAP-like repeat/FG-GAP repeat
MFIKRRLGVWCLGCLACFVLCMVVGVEPALTAPNPFTAAPGSPITTGTGATFVAVGDLNGDGKPDVVVVNTGAGNISVLLATGGGSFLAAVNYKVGTSPSDVAIADVNGDGRPDLVVTNTGSDSISVLLNVGGGAFSAPTTIPMTVGSGPEGVAIADVNGDGAPDIVVSNSSSNSVTVFLGAGFGTFAPGVNFTTQAGTAGFAPSDVVIADFNGDGRLDLATSDNDGNASILLGNGNGTFQAPTVINLNPSPTSTCSDPDALVTADLNGDSKPDIAVACTGGTVSILLGNGNGTFATPVSYTTATAGGIGSGPEAIAAADFDGKNGIDLVIADTGNDAVFLLNNGNGTFAASTACSPAGNGAFGVAAADFNGDGKPDIAVANSIDGTVSILLNNGTIAPGACGSTNPPPPPANFTVTVTPASVTTKAGTLVTFSVLVTPGSGFVEPVALTCTSSAPNSGCSLSPKSVPTQFGPATSTLSVATNFNSAGGAIFGRADPAQVPLSPLTKPVYAMLTFGGVGIFGVVLSTKRTQTKGKRLSGVVITILGILSILIALQGCGGKGSFPDQNHITPPGTYSVSVVGTTTVGKTSQSATGTAALVVN